MSEKLLKDHFVKINDINTRFWVAGDEGPTLVLIHGLGRSVESWRPNIPGLSEKFRVYALDLVGFGHSDKPSVSYSVPYLTQFVRDFLNHQGVESGTFIGNSMGGAVALQMAFSHPEIVDNLVLVDPAGFGTRLHIGLRLSTLPFIGECMARSSRKSAHFVLKTIFFDQSLISEEMIESDLEIAALPGTSNALLSTARSFLGIGGVKRGFVKSIMTNAHRLRCPTLVTWGKQDKILPVRQAHRASGVIQNAKLKLFDACGHAPQLEHPEAFNSTVIWFLRNRGRNT